MKRSTSSQYQKYVVDKEYKSVPHNQTDTSDFNEIKSILKPPRNISQLQDKHERSVKIMQKSQEHEPHLFRRQESVLMPGTEPKKKNSPSISIFMEKSKIISQMPSLDISKKSSFHKQKNASMDNKINRLDESENDIFNTNRQETMYRPLNKIFNTKLSNKIINKIGFITQKMTPHYQNSLKILESVENKVLNDIHFYADQSRQKILPTFSEELYGPNEVPVLYDSVKQPIEIGPLVWSVLEVRQMEFYYLKIRAKFQNMPLQFFMKQSNSLSSFKIFVSSSNAFPTKFCCDYIFTAKIWKIKSEGFKTFQSDYIYFSFVSEHDMVVKMKYNFGDLTALKVDQKTPSNRHYSSQSIKQMSTDMLFNEVARIKKRRRQKAQMVYGGGIKDIIKENIVTMHQFNSEQSKTFKQSTYKDLEEHSQQVIKKKKKLDVEEKRVIVLKVQAREAVQTINLHILQVNQARLKKKKITEGWFVFMYLAMLTSKINDTFRHKIHTIQQSRLMAFQVRRNLKRIQKKLSLTIGQSIEDRAKFDARICLGMVCKQLERKHQKLAVQFLAPILLKRAVVYNIQEKLLATHLKIKKVQQKFVEFILKKRNFQLMMQNMWDKFSHVAHSYCVLNCEDDTKLMNWYVLLQNDKQQAKVAREHFVKLYFHQRVMAFYGEIKIYSKNQRLMKQPQPPRRHGQMFVKQVNSILQEEHQLTIDDDSIQMMLHKLQSERITLELVRPRFFIVPLQNDIQQIYMQVFEYCTKQIPKIGINVTSNQISEQSQIQPKSPSKKK